MKQKSAVKQKRVQLTELQVVEKISKIAYELYERNGYVKGQDLNDWLIAERLVRSGK